MRCHAVYVFFISIAVVQTFTLASICPSGAEVEFLYSENIGCEFPTTNPQTLTYKSLRFDGTAAASVTIPDGTTLNIDENFHVDAALTLIIEGNVLLTANKMVVAGTISGEGKGATEGAGLGAYLDTTLGVLAGGAHGGRGGKTPKAKFGVQSAPYGNYQKPTTQGSGGMKGYSSHGKAFGGAGGAALKLTAWESFALDGTINMNGKQGHKPNSNYDKGGGGGSGGSVYIDAPLFSGSGTIHTDGGKATKGIPYSGSTLVSVISYSGGSGGGGRIAIYCTTDEFTGVLSSKGGALDDLFYLNSMTEEYKKETYKVLGSPGTIYHDCGDFKDTLTIDHGEQRIPHHQYTPIGYGSGTTVALKHLRLFNRAMVEFQTSSSSGSVTAEIGQLSGDKSGTIHIMPHGVVILSNNNLTTVSSEIETSSASITPHEVVVTSKTKYYMNNLLISSTNIQVHEGGKLITPPNLAIGSNTQLIVAGTLAGVESLVVSGGGQVHLKSTGYTDGQQANRYYFADLVIEDGAELFMEEIQRSIKCKAVPTSAGCWCQTGYATCTNGQYCVVDTCQDTPLPGIAAALTSNSFRLGASTSLDTIIAIKCKSNPYSAGCTCQTGYQTCTKGQYCVVDTCQDTPSPGIEESILTIKGGLNITTSTMVITRSGRIDGEGTGFDENEGPGSFSGQWGFYPGGSHGGRGGKQLNLKFGTQGQPYGSYKYPLGQGSGGDKGYSSHGKAFGGRGGGALTVTATESLRIDGTILMDGTQGWEATNQPNDYASGGGSGGSIWITTSSFAGTGTIQANGGLASKGRPSSEGTNPEQDVNYHGGGGGGGRIAVHCVSGGFTGVFSSKGGTLSRLFNLDSMADKIKAPMYKVVGGPGTVYQNCGDLRDVLTVDNAEPRISHHRNTPIVEVSAGDNDISTLTLTHLRLFGRAMIEFQSMLTAAVTVDVGQLSGDKSGTLDVIANSIVILSNNNLTTVSSEIETSSASITPHEVVVTSKTKYYMNNLLISSTNIQVHEGGKLITPPNLAIGSNTQLIVAGTLAGVESLVVSGGGQVHLKSTGYTDGQQANRYYFADLVIEDGAELFMEEIQRSIKCKAVPTSAGCWCQTGYATCTNGQYCVVDTCQDTPLPGIAAALTSNSFRLGASTSLDTIIAIKCKSNPYSAGCTCQTGYQTCTKGQYCVVDTCQDTPSPGIEESILTIKGGLNITTSTMVITRSGRIDGEGTGFDENEGPGSFSGQWGFYPGGSHGGRGGKQLNLKFGTQGQPYGSYKYPLGQGSGGDKGYSSHGKAFGGRGGGALTVTATESLRIDGTILMDGTQGWEATNQPNDYASGGGSGGSIWITTSSFAGTGTIQANGGLASKGRPSSEGTNPEQDVNYHGGGGGGGRIAVHCVSGGFTGVFSSKGGTLSRLFNLDSMADKIKAPMYKVVGGPGTVYQNCGDLRDVLTVDNAEPRISHHRNTPIVEVSAGDNDISTLTLTHLRLFGRAMIEFQSMLTAAVTVDVGQLSGDKSGTLDVIANSIVILSNNNLKLPSKQILLTSEQINQREIVVTSKSKHYVNDLLLSSTNILIQKSGKLVTPPLLTVTGGTTFSVAGHLAGAVSLVVSDQARVDLKSTGHTDSQQINQYQFYDLVIQDGSNVVVYGIPDGIRCGADPSSDGCWCNIAYATCSQGQYCVDETCRDQQVLGSAAVLETQSVRLQPNSMLTIKGSCNLTTENLTMSSTATISGNGGGHQEEQGPGYMQLREYMMSVGGSHGGRGGNQMSPPSNGVYNLDDEKYTKFNQNGGTYGSYKYPTTKGSGGAQAVSGSTPSAVDFGGWGGAALKITASTELMINGTISMDGDRGYDYSNTHKSGSGAGGSIWISTPLLRGMGSIRANGGTGMGGGNAHQWGMGTQGGGAGGGGRVAVYCTTNEFFGTFNSRAGGLEARISSYSDFPGHKARCAGPGTIYQQCGEIVDRLIFDTTSSCKSPTPISLAHGELSMKVETLEASKQEVILFEDDSLPVTVSVGNLEGDSSGLLQLARGQTLVVRGSKNDKRTRKNARELTMKPLPYTSTSVASDGILITAVATIEYMGNLTNPGIGVKVPLGAYLRFPPILRLTSTLSLDGHMSGVRNIIITGEMGYFQLLSSASGEMYTASPVPTFTFDSIYIVDGGRMHVGPVGEADGFSLTVGKLTVGMLSKVTDNRSCNISNVLNLVTLLSIQTLYPCESACMFPIFRSRSRKIQYWSGTTGFACII